MKLGLSDTSIGNVPMDDDAGRGAMKMVLPSVTCMLTMPWSWRRLRRFLR